MPIDWMDSKQTGTPNINPLDSGPTTTSNSVSPIRSVRPSIASFNPSGLWITLVTSLNIIPDSADKSVHLL